MTAGGAANSSTISLTVGRMTVGGQSRKDASSQRTDLLTPKSLERIGTWNVRTLYQTGKLAQTVDEMHNHNLCMLAVTEARWTKSGKQGLTSGDQILWSGRSDDIHQEGVALLINKRASNTLLKWQPISERLLYAQFDSRYARMSVVVAYAPTEDAEEEVKDSFYESLQTIIDTIPKHDVLLVLGDMNAKIGADNEHHERVMGKYGEGRRNGNGERFVEFCEENRFIIGGSIFDHKRIHKLTWKSPDGKTENQIDHVTINAKWRRTLRDVRVRRQADVGSDHYLVVAKLGLKLRKVKLGAAKARRFDTDLLKTKSSEFSLELHNKFSALETSGKETTIAEFNLAMQEAGKKVLGYRKRQKEEWLTAGTWDKIQERKDIKKKLLTTKSPRLKERMETAYKKKDKEVKYSARKDKKDYIDQLTEKAEQAARKKDMKTVYNITRKLSGKHQNQQECPTKDKEGNIIAGEKEKMERWAEHFRTILNRPDPTVLADIPEAEQDLVIETGDITLKEVRDAIKTLKAGKAPGEDEICPEMIKMGGETTVHTVHKILNRIWRNEDMPEEWETGLIIKLPKKGDLAECGNWRGITLLPTTMKVFCRIILNRMRVVVDKIIREEQAGFRPGKSCADQIFTLRQILEQCVEWNATLYVNFIDFEKAFDSIHRNSLWKILRYHGIPTKIVNIMKMLYNNPRCRVVCGNNITESFEVKTGVKQGCLLSPILFVLAMEWVLKETNKDGKRGIRWTLMQLLEDLDYADDLGLLSSKHQDMQAKTKKFDETSEKIGLRINKKKSKVMKINNKVDRPITVKDEPLEEVDVFEYLGSKVSKDGDAERDVNARLGKSRYAYTSLNKIWKAKNINITTKIRIYKSNVVSVLLYGSESWKTTNNIKHKLEVFQNRCLRRILGIYWPETISNKDLRKRTGMRSVESEVRARRWNWIGHVCRMERTAIPRVAMRWTPEGRRNRGRPRETWRRTVEREIREQGMTWETINTRAQDRGQWRGFVAALCTPSTEEE